MLSRWGHVLHLSIRADGDLVLPAVIMLFLPGSSGNQPLGHSWAGQRDPIVPVGLSFLPSCWAGVGIETCHRSEQHSAGKNNCTKRGL